MPERWFEYQGPIYVRPIGRGICLGNVKDKAWKDWGQLEDILASFATGHGRDGYANVRIRFEVLPT